MRHVLPFVLAASLSPLPALAHAILVSSTPKVGETVPAGHIAMTFHYNSRIDKRRSVLTLTSPDHTKTKLEIAADGPEDVLETAADLGTPGDYVVRWQVLAIDGHITRGDVPFHLTPAP